MQQGTAFSREKTFADNILLIQKTSYQRMLGSYTPSLLVLVSCVLSSQKEGKLLPEDF